MRERAPEPVDSPAEGSERTSHRRKRTLLLLQLLVTFLIDVGYCNTDTVMLMIRQGAAKERERQTAAAMSAAKARSRDKAAPGETCADRSSGVALPPLGGAGRGVNKAFCSLTVSVSIT